MTITNDFKYETDVEALQAHGIATLKDDGHYDEQGQWVTGYYHHLHGLYRDTLSSNNSHVRITCIILSVSACNLSDNGDIIIIVESTPNFLFDSTHNLRVRHLNSSGLARNSFNDSTFVQVIDIIMIRKTFSY